MDGGSSSSPVQSTSRGDMKRPHDPRAFTAEALDLDSNFDEDEADEERLEKAKKKARRHDLTQDAFKTSAKDRSKQRTGFEFYRNEEDKERGRINRADILSLNAYDRHKMLVNQYVLYFPGATKLLNRDSSKDKSDLDVVRENHRFLWDDGDDKAEDQLTWGQRIAKKYYTKLFKEYCICDLSRYKENKVAMRWRTQQEVFVGKGQFKCGARKCEESQYMRSWEVNFGYLEEGVKKNALVKVRLCPDCSYKLNYYHKKKDVTRKPKKDKKRKKKSKKKKSRSHSSSSSSSSGDESEDEEVRKMKEIKRKIEEEKEEKKSVKKASEIWSKPLDMEQEKSREEDFSEFLEDLFL